MVASKVVFIYRYLYGYKCVMINRVGAIISQIVECYYNVIITCILIQATAAKVPEVRAGGKSNAW